MSPKPPDHQRSDVPHEPAAGAASSRAWIVLMGLRACGKSTVGRRLAAERGVTFVDLDDQVRGRFGGRTISDIWANDGEPAFRAAEADCLAAVLAEPPGVLALGGGTPMIDAARSRLAAARRDGTAAVVYLRGTVERLESRLAAERGDRPPMGPGGANEVAWAFEQRDAPYREMADVVVDLDRILGPGASSEPRDGAARVAAVVDQELAVRE